MRPSNYSSNITSYNCALISTLTCYHACLCGASPASKIGFLGLLSTLLESPSAPEPTVPEPTPGSEHAPLGLSALALASQDSRKRTPTITTLNPEHLTPADVIHLPRDAHTLTVSFKPLLESSPNAVSSSVTPIPTSPVNATASRQLIPRSSTKVEPQPGVPHEVTLRAASGASDLEGVRFPAGLGCLYYHTPPAPCTPLAGALRLRTLSSLSSLSPLGLPSDPRAWTAESVRAAFARGRDFHMLDGMIPWHIPLLALPQGNYTAVRAMLLHERLVAPGVMRDAEREGRRWALKRHSSRVLARFGQPFVVDLSTKRLRFYFVGRRRVHRHVVRDLCSWNRQGADEAHQPFIGRLICAFERSDYPGHAGKAFVRIRVKKVLSPVRRNPRYSGPQNIPLPRAKDLLSRGVRQRVPDRTYNTDKDKRQWSLWLANTETVFRGMRVLFENDSEGMPGPGGKSRRE
ncbi:hypothetical protein GSI_12327 [Ganoderma sinense ZZ0214-1]|uniref:Uncharacterized protein n=1 Tax=Ganoderma sinense ZZ0214-1 TaxID=1077348 RepID=A0A2G8RYG6_9APHY|nr:hypothetical protein GSI_12327 [Ganoderma sinense ZZ0214-1]